MKKTSALLTIITFIFCIIPPAFSSSSLINDNHPQAEESIQEAIKLTQKLMTSDNNDKTRILNDFKSLVSKTPENDVIRNMYANNLIAEKHYEDGLKNIEILNKNNVTRINLLTQCMLKERLGNRDEKCYKDVITLSEKEHIVDSDYMSALFFAKDKRFENLKSELIKENKFKESDFLVFTLGQEKMLHEFYP